MLYSKRTKIIVVSSFVLGILLLVTGLTVTHTYAGMPTASTKRNQVLSYVHPTAIALTPKLSKPAAATAASLTAKEIAMKTVTPTNQSTSKPIVPRAAITAASTAAFHETTLYTSPTSDVSVNARGWAASNSGDAERMNRLAAEPMAEWYVDTAANVRSEANTYVSAAVAADQMPVLVTYNIPDRDCGSYSAGGAATTAAYNAWIAALTAGIGDRQAVVIVEPDALAGMDCLSSTDQQTRVGLIANAVHLLKANTKALVYIDAGNPNWQSASVMADRLAKADIAQADGFSLNVSNFYTTSANITYGTQLSQLLGGKHFVIDTSRNGNGPDGNNDWCNPAGRALGPLPTLKTGNSLVDAYLWVKGPGASDGACGPSEAGISAPVAGAWWPQYALSIMQNSGW